MPTVRCKSKSARLSQSDGPALRTLGSLPGAGAPAVALRTRPAASNGHGAGLLFEAPRGGVGDEIRAADAGRFGRQVDALRGRRVRHDVVALVALGHDQRHDDGHAAGCQVLTYIRALAQTVERAGLGQLGLVLSPESECLARILERLSHGRARRRAA